ncbi:LOW QUALITY PROTEIN: uncharacterized protein fuss [Bemisia tabaci]
MEIGPNIAVPSPTFCRDAPTSLKDTSNSHIQNSKVNQVGTVVLYGVPIVSLLIDAQERLCLAQISNTLLKNFSYNEIHNRRVALGITCVQCTPVQLEILRRAGAMPVSSRRCGMITRREAERLCKSFLGDNAPPRLPEDFAFSVHHECAWGCRGVFLPGRYNSSRAKCIKCSTCGLFFSPNKFIFHSHRIGPNPKYVQPDAANFNSWRRHMKLSGSPPDEIVYAWEDVKAMFNGGTRKRLVSASSPSNTSISVSKSRESSPPTFQLPAPPPRVPTLPMVMDYVWHHGSLKNPFVPTRPINWLSPATAAAASLQFGLPSGSNHPFLLNSNAAADPKFYQSAFRPVLASVAPTPALPCPHPHPRPLGSPGTPSDEDMLEDETTVDIETCPEDEEKPLSAQNIQRKHCIGKTKHQRDKQDCEARCRVVNSDSDGEESISGGGSKAFSIVGLTAPAVCSPGDLCRNGCYRTDDNENRSAVDHVKKPYLPSCLSLVARNDDPKLSPTDAANPVVYQPLATKPSIRSYSECTVCNVEPSSPSI